MITLAELRAGVLATTNPETRARRTATPDRGECRGARLPIVTHDDDHDPLDGVRGLAVTEV